MYSYLPLIVLWPQINGFQYSKWLNSSILPIHGTLQGTTTPGQIETVSKNNEGLHHIPQRSGIGASLSVRV